MFAFAISLVMIANVALAETGFIPIDKSSLPQAEKHGVFIQVTPEKDDTGSARFNVSIRITPVNESVNYTIELLIRGGSRIRMQVRLHDDLIFSEHWLTKDVMSNGSILISGISGHEESSPDNNLLIDLSSFL
jgi:hypothetical protein